MALESLEHLLVEELKDLYSAESQLVKALPKMAKGAASPELRAALEEHLEETRGHVKRLEQIFEERRANPGGKKCKGMEGLVEEGEEMLKEEGEDVVRDAGLIGAAQRVEHYEIAGYGTVLAHAEQLEKRDIVSLLEQTLEEEKAADKKLSRLAQRKVNVRAER